MDRWPKIQHLHAFRQIVRSRSIRAAAREMGLSQPAVSRTIRELEQTLSAQLFLRGHEGIRLTEAGEAFSRRVEWILEELQRATGEVEQIAHFSQGKLALGFSSLMAFTVLPSLLEEAKSLRPRMCVTLNEAQLSSQLPLLRKGELDLAIGAINPRNVPEDVVVEPLFTAPFCVLCRKGHPLEKVTSISELQRARWVFPDAHPGYYQQLQDEFSEFYRGLYEEPVWTESVISGLNLVLASDYLTVVARAMSNPFHLDERLSVLPIENLPSAQYCVVWSQKSALTEAAREFVLALRVACRQYRW